MEKKPQPCVIVAVVAVFAQREMVDLSISNLGLRSAGNMQFGKLSAANDVVNLSMGNLIGNGTLGFGVASAVHDSSGAITLTSGTYIADELNTVLGTDRFSGSGSLTVNFMRNNFNAWMVEYELSENEMLPSADPEQDGMNNLLEYALGGNPNVDDADLVLPKHFIIDVDGVKWMDYVYQRRTDAEARGLQYDVMVSTNLIAGQWVNLGQRAEYNTAPVDASFESVTNRISADVPVQFITLEVSEE